MAKSKKPEPLPAVPFGDPYAPPGYIGAVGEPSKAHPNGGAILEGAVEKPSAASAAADELNEALARVEAMLRGLNLGVSASVTIEAGDPGPDQCFTDLVFGKNEAGRWSLYLCSGPSGDEDQWRARELRSAPLGLRLAAAEAMPALVTKLYENHTSHVGRLKRATAALNHLAKELPKAAQRDDIDRMFEEMFRNSGR